LKCDWICSMYFSPCHVTGAVVSEKNRCEEQSEGVELSRVHRENGSRESRR
jgi:hypothetical protein